MLIKKGAKHKVSMRNYKVLGFFSHSPNTSESLLIFTIYVEDIVPCAKSVNLAIDSVSLHTRIYVLCGKGVGHPLSVVRPTVPSNQTIAIFGLRDHPPAILSNQSVPSTTYLKTINYFNRELIIFRKILKNNFLRAFVYQMNTEVIN